MTFVLVAAAMNSRASARSLPSLPFQAAAVVAGAVGLAVASRFALPPFPWGGPVPITLQTYALFVVAGLFGGRLALMAVGLWLAAAALGAPVLADGAAGWRALTGITMGFLAGMAAAAWVCGRGAERVQGWWRLTLLFLGGHAIVLAVGWAGLLSVMDLRPAFMDGILPFVPGAVAKSLAAALTVVAVRR